MPSVLVLLFFNVLAKCYHSGILLFFIVKASITVTIALAVDANNAVKNIPFSSHMGVRINRSPRI